MKKTIYLFSVILLGILVTTWYSCETEPEETCDQDEFCEEKIITLCCIEDDSNFKNGKEYSPEDEDQLARDLGCENIALKSADYERDIAAIIKKLHALMDKVQAKMK